MSIDVASEEPTDEALAASAVEDRDAFMVLYERYVGRVHAYLILKTGRQEAEDLAADVFTRALEGIHRFQPDRSFKGWLFGIAQNRFREYARQRGRKLSPEETVPASEDPEESALLEESIEVARKLVAALPSPQREVMELRYWADLPIRDVARMVGKSEGAVRVMIHRVLQAMKHELGVTG